MRISNNTINSGMILNINRAMSRMDKNYNDLASGKRIHVPSDDPVGLITSLRFKGAIRETERYIDNAEAAITWLNSSDAALAEFTTVLNRLETLAVSSATSTLTESSRVAIAEETRELKDHLMQIANTEQAGRYLFSGQQTRTPAYSDNFSYQGDASPVKIEVGAYTEMEISFTGQQVFGGFFDQLDDFMANTLSGDTNAVSQVDLQNIQDQLDNVLNIRASYGAKVNRLEQNVVRLETIDVQYSSLLSKVEDTDIAKVTMEMATQESVYKAALAVGARIMQSSLLNYI